jgi:magnesium transporter
MGRPRLFSIRRRSKPGAAPGTLIAPAGASPPIIDILAHSKDTCVERENAGIDLVQEIRAQQSVTWVNVTGLGDTGLIEQIAEVFGLHQLALEDVLNVHQRPKLEEFEDHLFIVTRMVAQPDSTDTEQVSIFLGKDFVLTLQEKEGDCFAPVRSRLRNGTSRLRSRGADYLAYALIDAVIDGYFPALESLGEELEQLEDIIVSYPQPESVGSLHDMKRRFLSLRRAVWPYRELLSALSRGEHRLLHRETRLYLRDCYDHVAQLMDLLETYREIASGLMDVYLSSASAKLGEIMKVLTIIATVFMPLSFITSLYGMNFDRRISVWNMPELGWRLGYPFSLALMAACAAVMIGYFWRKGWLGNRGSTAHRRRKL